MIKLTSSGLWSNRPSRNISRGTCTLCRPLSSSPFYYPVSIYTSVCLLYECVSPLHCLCRDPLVSSTTMWQRMEGRKMVCISQMSSQVKDGEIKEDWVTIGVMVNKLNPMDSVSVSVSLPLVLSLSLSLSLSLLFSLSCSLSLVLPLSLVVSLSLSLSSSLSLSPGSPSSFTLDPSRNTVLLFLLCHS